MNIKNHLHSFLVVGNKLFTEDFLKWYMKRYYGIELLEHKSNLTLFRVLFSIIFIYSYISFRLVLGK